MLNINNFGNAMKNQGDQGVYEEDLPSTRTPMLGGGPQGRGGGAVSTRSPADTNPNSISGPVMYSMDGISMNNLPVSANSTAVTNLNAQNPNYNFHRSTIPEKKVYESRSPIA